MLNLLKELCSINGVSSDEGPVRDFIRSKAQPYADSIRVDAAGNLIVFKKGKKSTGNRVLMAAHMDEVGVIVTRITDEGFLKFGFIGGMDRRVVIGKPVVIGDKQVPGVIGLKAIHLSEPEERKKAPKLDDLYIDIGAKDRESAEKLVSLGDCGAFVCEPEEFGDGLFKARALDDRVGCAVMLKLLEEELPLDITFVFTVQEEVGLRGIYGAAFSVTPEVALVLDTNSSAAIPGPDGYREGDFTPGKGPVVSFADGGAFYCPELVRQLCRLADENHIPLQFKDYLAGATDGSVIQRTKAGVRTAALCSPVRCCHAPSTIGSLSDFENMLKLARLFINHIAEEN